MLTAGSYIGDSYTVEDGESYKRLFVRIMCSKGYILIGEVERAGIYTSLIREQTPLDTLDFELIKEKPQLMAFTRRERVKVLAGQD